LAVNIIATVINWLLSSVHSDFTSISLGALGIMSWIQASLVRIDYIHIILIQQFPMSLCGNEMYILSMVTLKIFVQQYRLDILVFKKYKIKYIF